MNEELALVIVLGMMMFVALVGGISHKLLDHRKEITKLKAQDLQADAIRPLQDRLERIEQRLANLETLVIEREQQAPYERLEHHPREEARV